MAVVGEVRSQPITLSSDEEEIEEDIEETAEDVNYLFDRFILACRPHLQNDALVNARNIFKDSQRDFVASKEIASMLKRYSEQVNKDNAVVYMESFAATLADGKEEKQRRVPNHNNDVEELSRSNCEDGISDVSKARDFKEVESQDRGKNQTVTNVVAGDTSSKIEGSVAAVSDDEVDFLCEVKCKSKEDKIPSTSAQPAQPAQHSQSQKSVEIKLPKSGKLSTKDLSKKKLVAKLNTRLKEISQEIKILNKSELTLDEMEMADSNYIKENRLKQKFDKTWNKLCKILGSPPNTGRVVEKKLHASKTGYSIIDKAVKKFLSEKRGKFPNWFDIRDLVLKTNETNDLRMSSQVLDGLITDIFMDIGNKMQKLREKDLIFNFGSHLLDDFKTEEDPALVNEELCKQLERNRKISKKKLNQVYATFSLLERHSKAGRKGETSTSMDMVEREFEENGNSEGTTTDDDQELSKSVNDGFSLSEESVDTSQSCSSKTLRNASRTNYKRHSVSDEESSESPSQSCKSRRLLTHLFPKTVRSETKCPASECVVLRTVNSVSSALDKDSDIPVSCSSGALVNNTDQATSLKMDNSVDNATPIIIDNCQIVIDSQDDEEAVSTNQANGSPVSLACTAPTQSDEHKLPNIVNSTSVVNDKCKNNDCKNDDCENDDCQIIIDPPDKNVGVSNTSQTCDTLSSTFSVHTSSDKPKPNVDNPTIAPSDDCQIIIDSPDEEPCSSTTNQVHSKPKSPACSFPAMTNEQNPNIATANTVANTVVNSKFSANNCCHIIIDSTDETASDEANRTNGKKRKASIESSSEDLNCSLLEKVVSALRNKRLKTPCRNSTEIDPQLSLNKLLKREPLKDREIINGLNSPPAVNGKVLAQIPSQHRQAFREKTLNALKSKQQDMTVNLVDYRASASSISATESPRQETGNRTNSTKPIRTNCEKQECEVIIIDD